MANQAVSAEERRGRRWEFRRELIVQAAAEVFAEMGLERATLEAVADRVALNTASLYHYVKSKEELLELVVDAVLRQQEETVTRLTADGNGAEERLRAFCLAHLRYICQPAGAVVARLALAGVKDEPVRQSLRAYMGRLEAILDEGVVEGAFRPVDHRVARYSLIAALNAVPLWYSPDGPLTLEQVSTSICDLYLDGLRTPEPTRKRPSRPTK